MLWQVSYWVVPMNDLGRKVLGYGPVPAEVALVGEAPGEQEVEDGVPFVGKPGIELNGHYLPLAGLTRAKVYVTNLWKYRPPNNRDPNAAEIAEGLAELLPELAEVNPTVIVAVGRLSAGALLGRPVDMDKEHGIPIAWKNRVLLPVYHPAAGLHNTAMMSRIREDFTALRHLLIGVTQVPVIEPAEGWYEELHDMPHNGERRALLGDVVAVDTETDLGRPYCVQFSSWEGAGFLIRADNAEALADLGRHLAQPHVTTVMHNARFDIKVLLELGIHPAKVEDTMTMAYLLGNLPQRLKALAYRLLHVRMQEYSDVVAGSEAAVAMEWLEAAALREYPVPEPVLELKGNKFKVRQPQRYEKRLQALLKKARKNPALDVAEALRGMKDIEPVINIMGEVPESSVALIAPDRLVDYACADADMTLRVRNVLMPRIIEAGLEGVFARDMAAMVMVVAMEQAGMQIDVGRCEALAAELDADAWRLFNEVNEAMRLKPAAHGTGAYLDADCWFNPGSPDQMMKYLNAYGRYPKSTEAKYVKPYVAKDPVIAQILDYKHLVKLRSTYAVALPRKADVAGRVHTKLEMTRTETGRLASKEPNLSNIPVRDKLGNRIREAFVAAPGCKILSIDYSQIELRVAAHESQDAALIHDFITGIDPHTSTAATAFGIAYEDVDPKKHRYPMKRAGFGVLYGISAKGLLELFESEGIEGWTEQSCQELIDLWFGVHAGVERYMFHVQQRVRQDGKVRDMFGRYKLVPEVYSAHYWLVSRGMRQACNYPIQAGAQEIIKEAMGQLMHVMPEFNGSGRACTPLMQIHDELLFEVSDEQLTDVATVCKGIMENVVELCVPLKCDVEVGPSWGELKSFEM